MPSIFSILSRSSKIVPVLSNCLNDCKKYTKDNGEKILISVTDNNDVKDIDCYKECMDGFKVYNKKSEYKSKCELQHKLIKANSNAEGKDMMKVHPMGGKTKKRSNRKKKTKKRRCVK